jgi:hypothetical protein
MILDERLEFADALAIGDLNASASWQNIGDVIPRSGPTLKDIGVGEPLYLVIQVTTSITCGTDNTGTIAFRLVSDADPESINVSTCSVHWTGATITLNTTAVAAATAGVTLAVVALPMGDYEDNLALQALNGTRDLTAGAINAFLTRDVTRWRAYADNSVIGSVDPADVT